MCETLAFLKFQLSKKSVLPSHTRRTCHMSCPNLTIYFSVVWRNCSTVHSSRLDRSMSYKHLVLTKPHRSNTEVTKLPLLSRNREASSILQDHRYLAEVPLTRLPLYQFMTRDSICSIFANHPPTQRAKQLHLNVSCTNSS